MLKIIEVQPKMSGFNQSRYLELLKRSQNLKKQLKSLYRENEKEYFELLDSQIALSNHLNWTKRGELALLMENFINGVIDVDHAGEFCVDFFALRSKFIRSFNLFESEIDS